jgi:hypothetical protein
MNKGILQNNKGIIWDLTLSKYPNECGILSKHGIIGNLVRSVIAHAVITRVYLSAQCTT